MSCSLQNDRLVCWVEVAAVGATGVLHLLFKGLGAKGVFIALAMAGWSFYIIYRVRKDPSQWTAWGFRTDNLLPAFVWPTVLFVVAATAMAGFGLMHGRMSWKAHTPVLLVFYPLWGIIQQFLVQALGVTNLMRLFPGLGRIVAVPVGVVLFSVVHYPNEWLMVGTGFLAALFIPCYLQDRNLWPLGLYHGWLGTFFYLWVLGQDPWMTVFGRSGGGV